MEPVDRPRPHSLSLRILVEDLADTRTIRPVGPLDTITAPELLASLRDALMSRPPTLATDLSDVEFLGVAGLEVLLRMHRTAGRAGTAFILTGDPRPEVARLLDIVGLRVTTLRPIRGTSALGPPAGRAVAAGRVHPARCVAGSAPMRTAPS